MIKDKLNTNEGSSGGNGEGEAIRHRGEKSEMFGQIFHYQ